MKRIRVLSLLLLSLVVMTSCGETKTSITTPSDPSSSQQLSGNHSETTPVVSSTIAEPVEVLTDGNLSWDKTTATQVAKAKDGDPAFLAVSGLSFTLKGTAGATDAKIRITSSDTSVIPENAISYELKYIKDSNVLSGGVVQFDLTKVNLGTTYITLDFSSTTGNSPKGTIVKKVEVVSYGEVKTTHYEQKVTFDYSALKDDLWTRFSKGSVQYYFEAPYGSDIYEESSKKIAVDTENRKLTVAFNAIPDVVVSFTASYPKDEEGHIQHLAISQPSQDISKKDGYTIIKDTYNQSAKITFGDATVSTTITIKVLNQKA